MGWETSFRDALGHTLLQMGERMDNMVIVTADIGKSIRILEYKKRFPERYINTGISEADMVSHAAGLATVGLVPVVVDFAMFAVEKPFEQIRNSIAYPCLNVKIIATHGGIALGSRDGATHQTVEDIAIMRALPNMTVLTACDGAETKAAIEAGLAHTGPVYIRLGFSDDTDIVYKEDKQYVVGGSDTLREGNDVTIIACGIMVSTALKAAEKLSALGIEARVINMYSIKPLDTEAVLRAAADTGAVVTAEDHSRIGGLGGAVCEILATNRPVPVAMVAVQDVFGESGTMQDLLSKYGLTEDSIVEAVQHAVARKK